MDATSLSVLRGGRILFSRYRLERLVGRGGMGVVWLAHDEKLERAVALKFLPEILLLDPAARDDLKRETRRSLDLTHPHIVRIHDFVEDDEAAAIVMEYVNGPTLSQLRVDRPSRIFEVDDLRVWTAALCGALDYAHEAGRCVHRDLKPSNLMVSARGVLKVADFGIACGLNHGATCATAWPRVGGTLDYMSPQQLLGELPAPSDDLYSVGATLYELLTGKPPFFSGDIATQIREVRAESIAARRAQLGMSGGSVPAEWEETIAACLAKRPEDRPRGARDLARSLGLPLATAAEIAPALPENLAPTMRVPRAVLASTSLATRLRVRTRKAADLVVRFRWPLMTAAAFAAALAPWIWGVRPADYSAPVPPIAAAHSQMEPALAAEPAAAKIVAEPVQTDRRFLAEPLPAEIQRLPDAAESPQIVLLTEPPGIPFQIFAHAYETPDAPVLFRGETPATVAHLPPGGYRVRFVPPGSSPRSASVEIPAQGSTTFRQDFPSAAVRFTSQPAGAEIFCDEKLLGSAPLEAIVLAGKHEIGARWQGRNARVRTITLEADAEESVAFDFRATSATRARTRRFKKQEDDSIWDRMSRTINKVFPDKR